MTMATETENTLADSMESAWVFPFSTFSRLEIRTVADQLCMDCAKRSTAHAAVKPKVKAYNLTYHICGSKPSQLTTPFP